MRAAVRARGRERAAALFENGSGACNLKQQHLCTMRDAPQAVRLQQQSFKREPADRAGPDVTGILAVLNVHVLKDLSVCVCVCVCACARVRVTCMCTGVWVVRGDRPRGSSSRGLIQHSAVKSGSLMVYHLSPLGLWVNQ